MTTVKDILKKIDRDWISKHSGAVIIILLAVSLCLYFLFDGASSERDVDTSDAISATEYSEYMEGRLQEIIGRVSGVGKCEIMVLLREQGTKVYAVEEKVSESTSSDSAVNRFQGDSLTEKSYVLIQSQSSEYPVEITEYLPEISGIVVVCQGGDSATVKSEITELISALTGLPGNRIHVSRMTK
jgi:stage III sporulation protein AG